MKKIILENGTVLYRFEVGEKARIKRSRYFQSHKTPMWANGYTCTIVRNNNTSVTVRFDDYGENRYIDTFDLIPLREDNNGCSVKNTNIS